MPIPTDEELEELRRRFERLMNLVALGRVPHEPVAEMIEIHMPMEGMRNTCVPWSVDCRTAPQVKGAEVVLHHAYDNLRVTHGDLQIEHEILPYYLADHREDELPMRIGDKLLTPANLAFYLLKRRHLIPDDWWNRMVVMPGTVYESEDGRFVLGIKCERTLRVHHCAAGLQRVFPDEVRLVGVPFERLRRGNEWCAVMLNR